MRPIRLEGSFDWPALAMGVVFLFVMFAFLFRRKSRRVGVDITGIRVGDGNPLSWDSVTRLAYVRIGREARYDVVANTGVVSFTSDEAGTQEPEQLKKFIIGCAVLEPAPVEKGSSRRERKEEWTRGEVVTEKHLVSPPGGRLGKRVKTAGGIAAAFGIVLLKFKNLLLIGLKGGFKLLAALKTTALTMILSVGAYAIFWGWRFAVGAVLLILIHELGHAIVMKANGLKVNALVFIPFLGAYTSAKGQITHAAMMAEFAYGGPAAGALSGAACYAMAGLTNDPFWAALAYFAFFINLLNLIPSVPFDGYMIVMGISPKLWIPGILLTLGVVLYTGNPFLILILVLGFGQFWTLWQAARSGQMGRFFDLPPSYRVFMAVAYFGLCAYLGYMGHHTHGLIVRS